MSTHKEIQSALRDYLAGRMGSLCPERLTETMNRPPKGN